MSDRRPLIVGLVLAGLLGFAFFHFVVQPRLDERSTLDGQVEQKQTELAQAQALLADNTAARAEVRRTAAARVRLGTAVPDQPQTGGLVVLLGGIAERSGAKLTGVDLSAGASGTDAAAATEDAGAPSALTPQTATITMTGRYGQVQRALERIRMLVRTADGRVRVSGRLVAVDSVTLEQPEAEDADGLSATIVARAFTTSSDPAPAGETSPAGGGDPAAAATPTPESSSSSTTTTIR